MAMSYDDAHYMSLALQEAKIALANGEVPVGAVIVKGGEVIGRGHNTRENDKDISGHAEINAIVDAEKKLGKWTLEGCTLYVTLEPCLMCAGAIRQSRLSSIVFGAKDEREGAVLSRFHVFDGDNASQTIIHGILEGECAKVLDDFFDGLRNR